MADKTKEKNVFNLDHPKSQDFQKGLCLGIPFAIEIERAGSKFSINIDERIKTVQEKMLAKVGKKIPGFKEEVFTEDMCKALMNFFGKYGHVFTNF